MVEPFISGQEYAAAFLQLRVARSMFEGTKETVSMLTEELEKGATLEVGGYELSPGLHESLCLSSMESLDGRLPSRTLAIGCGRSEDSKRNASLKALVETWNDRGKSAEYKFVGTDPFWSQELPTVPQEAIMEVVSFLAKAG